MAALVLLSTPVSRTGADRPVCSPVDSGPSKLIGLRPLEPEASDPYGFEGQGFERVRSCFS